MTTTKEIFKNEIIKFFVNETGLTITKAKAKIKAKIKIDMYDDDITTSNVRLFYTSNPNYSGGLKNGFGIGFYICKTGLSGNNVIKI
jgi:hypothetical protein